MTIPETVRTPEEVRDLWDGIAPVWRMHSITDSILGVTRVRKSHFSNVTGDVLDVACGTGENFTYLSGAGSVTAIDLSPTMVALATDRSVRLGLNARVESADAGALPYDDDSFDVIISAMSSCTFPDHVAAFREMERVGRPGGRILLFEHGRSVVGWIARRQDAGIRKKVDSGNCRNNRDPRFEIEEARMEIVSHIRSHLGMIHRFEIAVR
jgi:ubiquinone/menaquinone biosynthesis C-methylase UbiE